MLIHYRSFCLLSVYQPTAIHLVFISSFVCQCLCDDNQAGLPFKSDSNYEFFPSDVSFIVQGRPIEAHRVILSARSPFFKRKFQVDWKDRKEVRFSKEKLSYSALYSLLHFFYSDRLEVAVDDMEDLIRICKVCKCESLLRILEKELVHQKYAQYKALGNVDNSVKRFILQGVSLPEEDRLPAALRRMLQITLANSTRELGDANDLHLFASKLQINDHMDDLADICVRVDKKFFRCHKVVLASRSEYFKARISRIKDFGEGKNEIAVHTLPFLEEHDLSKEAFEKMIEYM